MTQTDENTYGLELFEQISALPGIASAVGELMRNAEAGEMSGHIGVISLRLCNNPVLLRMSGEDLRRVCFVVGQEIAQVLRPSDRLYRIAALEWLIVLPNLLSVAAVQLAAFRLLKQFSTLPGRGLLSYVPRPALGTALWPDDGGNALFLLQSASIASLAAERNGADLQTYEAALDQGSDDDRELLEELRQVIANDQGLELYLQPQVELASGRCIGVECLLRWRRKNGVQVPPPQIIKSIEQIGKRTTFTPWLIRQGIQTQRHLRAIGIDVVLSINLSANDLLDVELPDLILQTLATWELPTDCILLEITETMMVEESAVVNKVLHRLREMGLHMSIDDFGTGYAGMSYLQRLPVHEVKIDQIFVRQLIQSERAQEIVKSIIRLARRLNLTVVAEGVENQAIAQLLRELDCHCGQGYVYSPPLAVADFVDWYHARHPAPENT